jgi:hypothetical protein
MGSHSSISVAVKGCSEGVHLDYLDCNNLLKATKQLKNCLSVCEEVRPYQVYSYYKMLHELTTRLKKSKRPVRKMLPCFTGGKQSLPHGWRKVYHCTVGERAGTSQIYLCIDS